MAAVNPTSTQPKTIDPDELGRALEVLNDIAMSASSIAHMIGALENDGSSPLRSDAEILLLALLLRIGWLADAGTKALGGSQFIGSAEDWELGRGTTAAAA